MEETTHHRPQDREIYYPSSANPSRLGRNLCHRCFWWRRCLLDYPHDRTLVKPNVSKVGLDSDVM